MNKRTPVQFRRQLLEVLRKIRDEGPAFPEFGLFRNIDEMIKTTMIVESIVIDVLINRSGGVNRTSWVGDVWKNPHMLSVMHKMISFIENEHHYLWMKPSRRELQQTENMLLKKEVVQLEQTNKQLVAQIELLQSAINKNCVSPDGEVVPDWVAELDLSKTNALRIVEGKAVIAAVKYCNRHLAFLGGCSGGAVQEVVTVAELINYAELLEGGL